MKFPNKGSTRREVSCQSLCVGPGLSVPGWDIQFNGWMEDKGLLCN